MVSTEDPPKIKSEKPFTTLECQSWGELLVPCFQGLWGFYSSVEPTSISCVGRRFLIGKIIINGRILQNPPHVRILFILRLYELGFTMRHKLFPFRIRWRLLKLGGCHMASRPVHLMSMHCRFVHYQPTGPESSGLFKWIRHP